MPIYEYKGQHFELADGLSKDEALAKIKKHLGEGSAEGPSFLDQTGVALKSGLTSSANALDRAWTGMALGLQHAVQGPNEEGDQMYRDLQERLQSRQQWANPDNIKPGLLPSVVGGAGALPSQMVSFLTTPVETGQKSLEYGEDMDTAQLNSATQGAVNFIGAGLPVSMTGGPIVRGISAGVMNAIQHLLGGKALESASKTEEAKKEFAPTVESTVQATMLGGLAGVALGPKGAQKAKSPANDIKGKLDILDRAKEGQASKGMTLDDVPQNVRDQQAFYNRGGLGDIPPEAVDHSKQMDLPFDSGPEEMKVAQYPDGMQRDMFVEQDLQQRLAQDHVTKKMQETDQAYAQKAQQESVAARVEQLKQKWERPVPKSQRGAIDVDAVKEAIDLFKRGALSAREMFKTWKGAYTENEFGVAEKALDNPKSNDTIVFMKPEDFHQYATTRSPRELNADYVPRLHESIKEGLASKSGLWEIPYLRVDKDGQVTAHEGRHRMDVFKEMGLDLVPVRIRKEALGKGWGEEEPPRTMIPQDFKNSPPSVKRIAAGIFPEPLTKRGVQLPKSMRGALDFGPIEEVDKIGKGVKPEKNLADAMNKIPGLEGQDLIYVPKSGYEVLDQVRGEADGPNLFTSLQSGLMHASEKGSSTLMKNAAQWLQYGQRMADYGITNVVKPLEGVFKKLSTKEMIEFSEVTRREMFDGKQYSPEELKAVGFTDKQLKAYTEFRDAQKKVLDVQNKGRAALGLDPITPRDAYLSSVFKGDYHLPVFDKKGRLLWYIQQENMGDAKKALKYIKENVPEADLNRLKVQYRPRPFAEVPSDVMAAYKDALKMFPEDDPITSKIQGLMEEYAQQKGYTMLGQQKHFMDKKNVRGFMGDQPWLSDKTNAYNQAEAQINYMKNAYRWSHMQEALGQIKPLLTDPEIINKQPNNYEVTKAYVLNNMGLSENMFKGFENYVGRAFGQSGNLPLNTTRFLKGVAYQLQLGGSIGYIIATPLQLIPALSAWHADLGLNMKSFFKDLPLTITDGIIGSGHELFREINEGKHTNKTGMTDFGKEAYAWGEANGVFSTNLFDENAGLGEHKIAAEGKNILGYTIAKPDQMSRWVAFLSFARHLDSLGLPREEAFQRAAELTSHVAVDMHKQARPLVVDKFGSMGEALYMYKAPIVNMLNTISIFARKAKEGNPGPLLAYIFAMGAMGGVLNLPGVNEVDGLWNKFKDHIAEHKPEWYSHVKDVGIKEFVLSNLPDNTWWGQIMGWGAASAGSQVNMASRFDQSVVDVQDPLRAISPLGQELKEWGSIGKFLENPNKQTFSQGIHDALMPPLGQGIMQRFDPSFKSGVKAEDGSWTGYRNPRDISNPETMVKRTPKEEFIKGLGLTALSEAQRRTKDYLSNEESGRVSKAQKASLDKMFSALMNDRPEDVAKYTKAYFTLYGDQDKFATYLNTEIQKVGMTPQEFKQAHVKGLSSIDKVIRRLEMDKGNK